ncbi:ImmA/IrrE family metallo-endopeptidase [Acidisphaera sp. S103]|uniref:ImmA/IrrE family metallo-endopeptidase n=1 Tax=Acidisphaera sp. S103 TaxID=1747223 RepID=UPI00131B9B99|nr:ImmA/IrrE family metallo-endopeptidase [Acidisphaera sp. S103]
MPFRHGFKAEANRIALKVRSALQLGPTDPLDPWVACNHFEISVICLSDLRDGDGTQVGRHFLRIEREAFSAVTIPDGCRRVIVHNDSHSSVRQRSNLTHELAHCFLGHSVTPLWTADGDRARDARVEEEAAFLGGSLLITNEAAHHIVKSRMEATAATIYGVSYDMLTYRLRVSGAQITAFRRARRSLISS